MGATKPDKCPLISYEYAQSNGCPPSEETEDDQSDILSEDSSSGSDMTLMYILTAVGGVIVIALIAAVGMLLRKPNSPKKRPENEFSSAPDIDSSIESDEVVEAVTWVQSWEQLPSGGEYLPVDSEGVVWYRTSDGEHWRQEHDHSWSLWQG